MTTPLALKVGIQFVKEYYGKMSRQPEALFNMYARDSTMINITGSDGGPVRSAGVDEIKEKLVTWTKETAERKFTISSIESQPCHSDGFFVHVKGVLLTREAERQFTHIFVLGKSQPKADEQGRYYISIDFLEVGDNTRTQSPVEAWAGQGGFESPKQTVTPDPTPKPQPEAFTALEPTTDDVPPVPEPEPVVVAPPAVVTAAIEEEEQPAQEEVQPEEPLQEEMVEEIVEETEEAAPAEPVPEEPVAEEQVQEPLAETEEPEPTPVAQAEPEVVEEPVTADDDAGAVASSWLGVLKGGSRGQTAQRGPGTRVVGGRVPQAARYDEQNVQKKEETTRPAGNRRPPADRPAAEPKPKSPRRAGGGGGLDSRYKYPALYVSKIPPAMTEQEIDDLFSKYGKVISKTLKREQHCCFIDFADRAAIEKALADTQYVGDVRLHVQERMSPEERAKQRDRQESKRGATGGSTAPRRQGGRQGN